jgi:hypothetical protein
MRFRKRRSNKSKHHLNLKDGETVQGVFVGDPVEFEQSYKGGELSFRFVVNFAIKENGAITAKIFETGWLAYKEMQELNEEYPLETWMVKIKRDGENKDTRYTITPMKKGEVTKAMKKQIKDLDLHNLREMVEKRKDAVLSEDQDVDVSEDAGEGPGW